jgi:hypothetical protein
MTGAGALKIRQLEFAQISNQHRLGLCWMELPLNIFISQF